MDSGVDLLDQFQLLLYGIHIRSARYVGAGLLQALDHTGLYRVGHSGNKNRYLVGSRSCRLGAGGGYGEDKINLVGDEPLGDSDSRCHFTLGVFKIKNNIIPFYKTFILQPFNETLPGRVEGGMFHDLDNADFIRLRSLRPLLN